MRSLAPLPSLLMLASALQAAEWHSQSDGELHYQASWEGTSLPGRFGSFEVQLICDDEQIEGGVLTVSVNLGAADMDDPDINEAIAGEEWFSVQQHPIARYRSFSLEKSAADEFMVRGELELKGVRKPFELNFKWSEDDKTATMSGEFLVDRTDYDVGSGEWSSGDTIGKNVNVRFDIVMTRK